MCVASRKTSLLDVVGMRRGKPEEASGAQILDRSDRCRIIPAAPHMCLPEGALGIRHGGKGGVVHGGQHAASITWHSSSPSPHASSLFMGRRRCACPAYLQRPETENARHPSPLPKLPGASATRLSRRVHRIDHEHVTACHLTIENCRLINLYVDFRLYIILEEG
jgi:hypothetical protein